MYLQGSSLKNRIKETVRREEKHGAVFYYNWLFQLLKVAESVWVAREFCKPWGWFQNLIIGTWAVRLTHFWWSVNNICHSGKETGGLWDLRGLKSEVERERKVLYRFGTRKSPWPGKSPIGLTMLKTGSEVGLFEKKN